MCDFGWTLGQERACNMTTLYRAGCLEGSADIQKEREKKILKQKMLILLPFLRQLIPKIELIRNTSSSLIMLSAILRNFSTIPLFFIFYLTRLKTVVSGNCGTCASAAFRMLMLHFTRAYTYLRAQGYAGMQGGRGNFAPYYLHPQRLGHDQSFREDSPRWQLVISGCIIPGWAAARPRV